MKRSAQVAFLLTLLSSQLSAAQGAPSPSVPDAAAPPSAQTAGESSTEPSSSPPLPAPDGGTQGAQAPGAPESSTRAEDPMLSPIPAPARILTDWRDALQMVRTQSSDYLVAQSNIEAALGRSRMALAAALPQLTANANYQYHLLTSEVERGTNPLTGEPIIQRIPDPREALNLGGTLRIPVLAVRTWYDYSTAKRSAEQAEISREDAERQIVAGLAEAMVTVVTNERLSEVTRVNLAAAIETLELNARRAELGAGSAIDVLRSRQEVAQSRAQVVAADEALRQSREALGQALGLAEPVGLTPDIKLDQLRADARSTCQTSTNPLERADVRAAAAGAAIAERNVRSVMFDHLPTIDFVSNFNHTTNGSIAFVQTTWTIGAALTWRLYDGGLRYGEKRLNQALLTQAQENTRRTERLATIQASQAVRGVSVAQASLELSQETQKIAQESAHLAKAKFLNGSGTSFDMVDTQRAAREAELDVTVKEFELLRAEIIAFLALASCDL
jgi:outer membrane protein TolC